VDENSWIFTVEKQAQHYSGSEGKDQLHRWAPSTIPHINQIHRWAPCTIPSISHESRLKE